MFHRTMFSLEIKRVVAAFVILVGALSVLGCSANSAAGGGA